MGNQGVEGEALSSPNGASASLSTWKAENPAERAGLKGAAYRVAEHELWLLAVVIPVLIFPELVPESLITLALILIPIPWICRWITRGYLTLRTPMDFPIFGILVMLPVSLYASVDLDLSLVTVYQMVAGVALFYGLVNSQRSMATVWRVANLLMAAGMSLSLVGPIATEWTTQNFLFLPQLYKRFPLLLRDPINSNVIAGALVMIVAIPLALLVFGAEMPSMTHDLEIDERRLRFEHWSMGSSGWLFRRVLCVVYRPFLGLATIAMLATIVLTQSRGGLVALAIVILVLSAARSRVTLLLVLLLLSITGLFVVRFVGIEEVGDILLTTGGVGGWQARQEVWSRGIYMIQDFPYTGIGLRTFARVAPVMYPFFILGPEAGVLHTHNLFLQVAVDLGLPGLLAYLALLTVSVFLAVQAFRAFRQQRQHALQALAISAFCALVAMLMHGVLDAAVWQSKTSIILWAIMAQIVVLHCIARSSTIAASNVSEISRSES